MVELLLEQNLYERIVEPLLDDDFNEPVRSCCGSTRFDEDIWYDVFDWWMGTSGKIKKEYVILCDLKKKNNCIITIAWIAKKIWLNRSWKTLVFSC
jgi:hypothetical protein